MTATATLTLLPLGLLVGAAEFAVCGLLSTIVVGAVRREPVDESNWLALVHSDVLGPGRDLARRRSWPLVVAALVLFGLVHEVLLRFGAFTLAGGGALAVPVSVGLSLLVVVVPVRDRGVEARCVAAVVGAITGTVHAVLYASERSVWPLALAEGAFLVLGTG
ncbi:hypothetical protein AB0G73_32125 [Streptomyces sp. NPDC020719]|uniref:hypothetical protein n=1 Tax=Streptomyces sp. NPDC020719 TaxID=3154896 RepID=UPI0033E05C7B